MPYEAAANYLKKLLLSRLAGGSGLVIDLRAGLDDVELAGFSVEV
jgi:hypothetical protein